MLKMVEDMNGSSKPLTIGFGVGLIILVTACATPTGVVVPPGAPAPSLSYYEPPEIIVGTRNSGTLKIVGGCVVFERVQPAGHRSPALFPPGSTWVDRSTAIRLPDGQLIPIGRTVEIAYESPPDDRSELPGCAGDPIYILNVVDKE
ncbi:MAG: hypothetical protein M3Q42_03425 [Pseudomonadota bacterium]|nr:hypothetical protein [Pseudomonadota bacterium]